MAKLSSKLQLISPNLLQPYEKNARTHSEEQVEQIAASIREFGFTNPILIDGDKGIVAGHGRLRAAKKLGLKQVPVIDLGPLTAAQKRAYVLADNKIALNAGWDEALLAEELAALEADDFELDLLGFSDAELDSLLADFDPADLDQDDDSGEIGPDGTAAKTTLATKEDLAANPYTQKIKSPIYTPKGERPEIRELFDLAKSAELIAEITAAPSVPDDVKEFLVAAAQRHVVFNYQQIAEFYAHASADVQNLMERSALVIIDFNKAIENGFVVLSKEMAEAYPKNEQ